MSDLNYTINKGINRPLEFRGLKAQYIFYLAIGLVILLLAFAILYIAGVPVYLCMPVVLIIGSGLFTGVYRLSHRFGQHGLMKYLAFRQAPSAIFLKSRNTFNGLVIKEDVKHDNRNDNYGRAVTGSHNPAKQGTGK